MISKIERGEASPTAAMLGKLSGAFEITMATLLARAEGAAGRLMREAAQGVWRDPETGYLRRQRYARPGGPAELVEVRLPAGARVGYPAASYAFIRHVVWLIEGRLIIDEGDESHALEAGDCLEFGAPVDTAYENPGHGACRYLVVVVPK
jgi:transcriptional regulator with XRE-family HTH domain